MVKKTTEIEPKQDPITTETEPKRPKGQSKERMAELSKIANETKKMTAKIKHFDKQTAKQNAKDEMLQKYEMIQQLEAQKNAPQEEETEVIDKVPLEVPVADCKTTKKKKIRVVEEIIEEEESESESEDEEIVIKQIIKKVPRKKKEPSTEELYALSNEDILKRRFYNARMKRVNTDLFDF